MAPSISCLSGDKSSWVLISSALKDFSQNYNGSGSHLSTMCPLERAINSRSRVNCEHMLHKLYAIGNQRPKPFKAL